MNEVYAAWVQAIGSVVAIWASFRIANREHQQELLDEKRRRDVEAREKMERLDSVILDAQEQIRSLTDDPDEPGALARHWRERANDSVALQLARTEFSLQQLQAVPVLDIPVGANVVRTLNEAAYALIVAKAALVEAASRPFSADTPQRISDAIFPTAKVAVGKAFLRSRAIRRAQADA